MGSNQLTYKVISFEDSSMKGGLEFYRFVDRPFPELWDVRWKNRKLVGFTKKCSKFEGAKQIQVEAHFILQNLFFYSVNDLKPYFKFI